MEIRLKNTTGSDVQINDMDGLTIPALTEIIVTGPNANSTFTDAEISDSSDLVTLMAAGTVVMNDGENTGNLDLSEEYGSFSFSVSGKLKDEPEIDGYRLMPFKGKIVRVIASLNKRGKTGSTIFDILKASPGLDITTQVNNTAFSTVYTTSTKPTLTGLTSNKDDNAIVEATLPDVVDFNAGDMFKLSISQAAKKAIDANVLIIYQKV